MQRPATRDTAGLVPNLPTPTGKTRTESESWRMAPGPHRISSNEVPCTSTSKIAPQDETQEARPACNVRRLRVIIAPITGKRKHPGDGPFGRPIGVQTMALATMSHMDVSSGHGPKIVIVTETTMIAGLAIDG